MNWTFDPARYEGHTEGEWIACDGWVILDNGEDSSIADCDFRPAPEADVNARLIADAPHLLAEVLRLRAENERLHDRLEDNVMGDEHGNLVPCEPGSIPDGIACRDETIKLQRQRLDELAAENERLKADAARLAWMAKIKDWDWPAHWEDYANLREAIDAAMAKERPE